MLTEDQIKEKEFTPDQIELVKSVYATKEAEFLALANKNADGIFNGAAEKLTALTGISKGDKEQYSTYFERLGTEWLPSNAEQRILDAEKKANDKVIEFEEKVKNHKGDESLKIELQKAKDELAKIPDLLKAKDEDWLKKYNTLETEHKTSKLNRSMTDSMPKFDDNVNQFELEAKKKNAIERISTNYELSFDEKGNLIGTKDYQKTLVSELLKNDSELKDLILIDQGAGGGAGGGNANTKTLSIPESIGKGAAQQLIKMHIIKNENIAELDDKFASRFKELCKENKVL